MKKILLLGFISFLFSSFIPEKEIVAEKAQPANQKLCGPGITLTNPTLPGNGGPDSFNMMTVNFNYSDGYNTTYTPYLFTGEADISFPERGGYATVSVKVYTDWVQLPNYIGIKDDSGQIYQCFQLTYGTQTYMFNQILLHCQHYTIFITDQPC